MRVETRQRGAANRGKRPEDAEGQPLEEAKTPQMEFKMRLPQSVPAMSFARHAVDLSGR